MKTGMQTEARGSAFVEMGRTKVLVSVHGPLETNVRTLEEEGFITMSLRFAPFSSREVSEGLEPTEDKNLMYRIRKTIDTVLCRVCRPFFLV
jgi:exosome complex component MTR3